jgi:hypothetical protein
MIEDYEDTVKKLIINAARNALSILQLDWRSSVFRTCRQVDFDPLWRVDLFDKDNHLKWITFTDPPYLVDEAWYTAEIIRLLKELIH